jgi:hypothetical protein
MEPPSTSCHVAPRSPDEATLGPQCGLMAPASRVGDASLPSTQASEGTSLIGKAGPSTIHSPSVLLASHSPLRVPIATIIPAPLRWPQPQEVSPESGTDGKQFVTA